MEFNSKILKAELFEDFSFKIPAFSRSLILKEGEFIERVKIDCGDWISKPFLFVRGTRTTEDFLYLDPSKKVRKMPIASEGFGYFGEWYNYHIENDEKWRGFPKRRNSVMGSSFRHGGFGPSWYFVIPVNGFKLGVVKDHMDLFDGMQHFSNSLGIYSFSDSRELLFKTHQHFVETNLIPAVNSWESWIKFLEFVDYKKIDKWQTDSYNGSNLLNFQNNLKRLLKRGEDVINIFAKKGEDLFDIFSDLMNPVKNDVRLLNHHNSEQLEGFHTSEIWTDSNCYLHIIETPYTEESINNQLKNLIEKLK